jgi:hypothetical protein
MRTTSQHDDSQSPTTDRVPEARYAYYRRCQVFRNGSEQCKAPAEKGALICHAHAAQTAMAVRRERERRAVLAEAVAQMRRRGKPECEMRDLFMDFNGIQVTLAVMAQALIDGRIDCKTAGRLVVDLQTVSKLLRMAHRKGTSTTEARRHGEKPRLPQICADDRGLDKLQRPTELFTTSTRATETNPGRNWAANQCEVTRIDLTAKVHAFANRCRLPHGPPGWPTAA